MRASREFGADRKKMNSSVLARKEIDEEERILVAKVLLLVRCTVKRVLKAPNWVS